MSTLTPFNVAGYGGEAVWLLLARLVPTRATNSPGVIGFPAGANPAAFWIFWGFRKTPLPLSAGICTPRKTSKAPGSDGLIADPTTAFPPAPKPTSVNSMVPDPSPFNAYALMPVKSYAPNPRALYRFVQVSLPAPRAATAPAYPVMSNGCAEGFQRNPAPQKSAFHVAFVMPDEALTPIRMS